jgi:hypothetical protein
MKKRHNHIQVREKCRCVSTQPIIADELKWDQTYQTTAGSPRALPIPGRDLSGVVEEVGPGVTTLGFYR